MRQAGALLVGLAVASGATPALAEPSAYDIAFVTEFADACVPGRLGYKSSQDAARAAGWLATETSAHPELAIIMGMSEAAVATEAEGNPEFAYQAFAKPFEGVTHYLVVSRAEFDDPVEPGGRWALIGCYLYNFEADQPIDPEPVTVLIGAPVAQSQIDMHLASWLWGPPPALPRTMDTYLTFIPEVSQFKDETGFSGLVLKFDTSEAEAE